MHSRPSPHSFNLSFVIQSFLSLSLSCFFHLISLPCFFLFPFPCPLYFSTHWWAKPPSSAIPRNLTENLKGALYEQWKDSGDVVLWEWLSHNRNFFFFKFFLLDCRPPKSPSVQVVYRFLTYLSDFRPIFEQSNFGTQPNWTVV